MTHEVANRFLQDVQRDVENRDLIGRNFYLSIRGIGTKVFHNATYQIVDDWLFVWSEDETFCVPKIDLGDFVCIDVDSQHNNI